MKKAPKLPKDLSMQTLRKVLAVIRRYRLLLLVSILLAVLTVVLQLYVPVLFGDAVDRIVEPGKVDFAGLEGILLRILVMILAAAAGTWAMNMINNRLAFRTVQDIRRLIPAD